MMLKPKPKGGMQIMWGPIVLAMLGTTFADEPSQEFLPPVRLEAAGKPIDTEVGHAAPFVVDFDGDGVKDLLVGQFGDGILWFYKNVGTNEHPQYAAGVKFKDGKPEGRVPTG